MESSKFVKKHLTEKKVLCISSENLLKEKEKEKERSGNFFSCSSSGSLKWQAVAPSNVALIKYMGKNVHGKNQALNSSLSLTTPHLLSFVELSLTSGSISSKEKLLSLEKERRKEKASYSSLDQLEQLDQDEKKLDRKDLWFSFDGQDRKEEKEDFPTNSFDFSGLSLQKRSFLKSFFSIKLSPLEQDRFLRHLQCLKKKWNLSFCFTVRSSNNFPSSAGLASSASSFAALTLCAARAKSGLESLRNKPRRVFSKNELSQLSQEASGSSCRSFFSPWSLWRKGERGAREITGLPHLYHMVVVVQQQKKLVSSSEAHKRVTSSALFSGRPERAEKRLRDLIQALRTQDWPQAFSIAWAELWDLQALFETSSPRFGYLCQESLMVLEEIKKTWQQQKDGPLVTMDAGPNIHLFFRKNQRMVAQKIMSHFRKKFSVISDPFLLTSIHFGY